MSVTSARYFFGRGGTNLTQIPQNRNRLLQQPRPPITNVLGRLGKAQQPFEVGQIASRRNGDPTVRLFGKVEVREDQREAAHGGIVSDP